MEPMLSPKYLSWLFGPSGLKGPMDFSQFVFVAHQYMVYMREVFGVECMLCALG
jgi:hypothetical protein